MLHLQTMQSLLQLIEPTHIKGWVCQTVETMLIVNGTHVEVHGLYSEQKNRHTKGQISLVRQIAAQLTKVYPWKIRITKVDILHFDVPSNKHLASFVDFILTLKWDPLDETVFLHTVKLALQIHIT